MLENDLCGVAYHEQMDSFPQANPTYAVFVVAIQHMLEWRIITPLVYYKMTFNTSALEIST